MASLFITIPYTLLPSWPNLKYQNETGVNILLDATLFDIDVIVAFARRNNIKYMISLSTHMLSGSPDEMFDKIYTLFTLSDACSETINAIPLFSRPQEPAPESWQRLQSFFKQQGEYTVNFITSELNTNSIRDSILFCSNAHLGMLDAYGLENYLPHRIKKIIVWYGDTTQTGESTHTDFAALTKQNTYAVMLFIAVAHNSIAEQHHHQSLLWQQRAKLYVSFISLGKRISQDAYYGIKEWYDTEYEVLPLWYKRFGHIIKVFMGKRSLKSLFDDDSEKY
jgi:hypothetical protein